MGLSKITVTCPKTDIWLQLNFDRRDRLGSCSCCFPGIFNRRWLVFLKKEDVCRNDPGIFYVLGRGRHIVNKHGAIMRLRHNLVIEKFYVDGGGGSTFWKL